MNLLSSGSRSGILALLWASSAFAAESWKPLLDPELSQWDVWMGVPHESVQGLPEGTPTSPDGHEGTPLGLGNDPKKVFSVRDENGESILHITGEIYGGLTSRKTFGDFHLRTEFRWGERKWAPRLNELRDNGILYHCTGAHGVFWNAWKRCLEFQVQEGDMGDLYLLGGTRADVRVTEHGKQMFYDPEGEVKTFGAGAIDRSPVHLDGDFEKPHGEWNLLEIYAVGGDAVHLVNGHVVLVLTDAANGSGPQAEPLTAGQLQIQSEAAECDYRKMEIRAIDDFPAEIRKAAGL